jgi:putative FmdB family regulatory protein
MPLYEYKCGSCGKTFEVIQKFADEPLKIHPECGGEVVRLFSAPAFHLKGTGWYATDYGKKSNGPDSTSKDSKSNDKDHESKSKDDSKSKDSESKDAKSADSKSESKPAETTTASTTESKPSTSAT